MKPSATLYAHWRRSGSLRAVALGAGIREGHEHRVPRRIDVPLVDEGALRSHRRCIREPIGCGSAPGTRTWGSIRTRSVVTPVLRDEGSNPGCLDQNEECSQLHHPGMKGCIQSFQLHHSGQSRPTIRPIDTRTYVLATQTEIRRRAAAGGDPQFSFVGGDPPLPQLPKRRRQLAHAPEVRPALEHLDRSLRPGSDQERGTASAKALARAGHGS